MSDAYQALIDSLRDHQNGGRRNECEEAARAIETLRAELTEARRDFRERLIALCQQWTPTNLDRCETPEEIIREVAEGPHSQPAVQEAVALLKEIRTDVASFPRSLGYDMTCLPKIERLAAILSATDSEGRKP